MTPEYFFQHNRPPVDLKGELPLDDPKYLLNTSFRTLLEISPKVNKFKSRHIYANTDCEMKLSPFYH